MNKRLLLLSSSVVALSAAAILVIILVSEHPSSIPVWVLALILAGALSATFIISIRLSKETAERLQRQKRQMTNNIAHELRTPVTSIRAYLETLQANPDMDEVHRKLFIDRAYSQSVRLSELIRDIALVTKVEQAPSMFTRETVDVGKVVKEVLEEFEEEISQGHFVVKNSVETGLYLVGNKTLIYSIFRNLLENSVRYAGKGATIGIESTPASEAQGRVGFRYFDTGTGVPPKQLERIFERFYRIQSAESPKDEGSGLGLSIVRNAIAFHGGEVKAKLLQPHGLCFEFDL